VGKGNVKDTAGLAVDQIVPTLGRLLLADQELVTRKKLYVARGCRGDWPELMPEDEAAAGSSSSSSSSSEAAGST
jgi:hypothetical protein